MIKTRYAWIGVLLLAVLVGGIFLIKQNRSFVFSDEKIDPTKSKGRPAAPIQIVEYSDFQCPSCKYALPMVQQILETYPDKIHFVFRHFPLASHSHSPIAHQAAECAAQEGKFWPFHDRLYENQQVWSAVERPAELFLTYARESGIDLERFAACLPDKEITKRILEDKKKGEEMVVRSTPTFFINGERFVGGVELSKKGNDFIQEQLGTKG